MTMLERFFLAGDPNKMLFFRRFWHKEKEKAVTVNIAELIEKLIIDCLKSQHTECELHGELDRILEKGGVEELVKQLVKANHDLWDLCQVKWAAATDKKIPEAVLRDMMKRDVELCRSRAELRAAINERLGDGTADGSTIKVYGN